MLKAVGKGGHAGELMGGTSWRWKARTSPVKDEQDVWGDPHRTGHTPLETCRFEQLAGCGEIRLARAKPCV